MSSDTAGRGSRPRILPAATTPFGPGGELDLAAARRLLAFLDHSHVDGVFVAGTTGEFVTLDDKERLGLFEVALETCTEATPYLQVGGASTWTARKLVRSAVAMGAERLAAVTPYYHAADNDALYRYFAELADAADGTPLYAYTIPSRAGNPVTPELLKRLVDVDNITGIKLSLDSLDDIDAYVAAADGAEVLCGSDGLALPAVRAGAGGVVSGPAAAVPEPYVELADALGAGDAAASTAAQERIDLLLRTVTGDPNRIKAAQVERGLPGGECRAVLPQLTAADRAGIAATVRTFTGGGHRRADRGDRR